MIHHTTFSSIKNGALLGVLLAALLTSGCGKAGDVSDAVPAMEAGTSPADTASAQTPDTEEASFEDSASASDDSVSGSEDDFHEGSNYTFTDAAGYEVSVPFRPARTAVMFASYCDIWLNTGGSVDVTVEDAVTRKLVSENVPLAGSAGGKTVDAEKLLAQEPDFVILSADYQSHVQLAELLRTQDVPVALLRIDTFEEYLDVLRLFSTINENTDAYRKYGETVKEEIDSILSRVPKVDPAPKILFLRAFSTGAKAKSDDNFVGVMLKSLGSDNIADHSDILLEELSMEAIAAEDPDLIFVSTMGEDTQAAIDYLDTQTQDNPVWNSLTAIKNERFYILPKDLFLYKPNDRWAEAYRYLASILYPEIFGEEAENG